MENKTYSIGDTLAVMRGKKAVSCQVIEKGIGETKNGTTITFQDEQVIWRLGANKKWPNFVHQAFRGELAERNDNNAGTKT